MKKPDFKMPTVFAKKIEPEPVFNQPVPLQRNYKIARGLQTTLLILIIICATVVIILKVMTINFVEDNRETGFEWKGEEQAVLMAALPRKLYNAPAKIALVAGAISICVGVGHFLFITIDWKHGTKTQAYASRRNLMFLHFGNSVLALLALISLNITHKASSHFSDRYINSKADLDSYLDGMRYDRGTFDLETWSCEFRNVAGAKSVWEDYGKQCAIESAGRGMIIPFLIAAWSLCGLSVWLMIEGWRDADGERIKTEQVELELGKMNATNEH